MQYNRKEMSSLSGKQFEVGPHIAKIKSVEAGKSKGGNDMFKLSLEGKNGESADNYFTFGLKWSDGNMQRILASVEDNNQKIAPIDYGYNKETVNFLKGKNVFILVAERTGTYIDKEGFEKQSTGTEIKSFLSRSEFASYGGGQQQQNQHDPFGNSAPMNISDDDLPF